MCRFVDCPSDTGSVDESTGGAGEVGQPGWQEAELRQTGQEEEGPQQDNIDYSTNTVDSGAEEGVSGEHGAENGVVGEETEGGDDAQGLQKIVPETEGQGETVEQKPQKSLNQPNSDSPVIDTQAPGVGGEYRLTKYVRGTIHTCVYC